MNKYPLFLPTVASTIEWAKSRIGPSRFKSTRFGPQVDLTRFAVYGLTRLKQLDDGRYNCFACTSISFWKVILLLKYLCNDEI